MKALWLTLSLLITSGCAQYEPTQSPWTELERVSEEARYPAEPPELAEDASNLDEVLEAAAGNYAIARGNAEALERMSRAYNRALEAGDAEHAISEARARMLIEERRARFWSKVQWGSAGVLGLIIGLQ